MLAEISKVFRLLQDVYIILGKQPSRWELEGLGGGVGPPPQRVQRRAIGPARVNKWKNCIYPVSASSTMPRQYQLMSYSRPPVTVSRDGEVNGNDQFHFYLMYFP